MLENICVLGRCWARSWSSQWFSKVCACVCSVRERKQMRQNVHNREPSGKLFITFFLQPYFRRELLKPTDSTETYNTDASQKHYAKLTKEVSGTGTKDHILHMILFRERSGKDKTTVTESRSVIARGWGGRWGTSVVTELLWISLRKTQWPLQQARFLRPLLFLTHGRLPSQHSKWVSKLHCSRGFYRGRKDTCGTRGGDSPSENCSHQSQCKILGGVCWLDQRWEGTESQTVRISSDVCQDSGNHYKKTSCGEGSDTWDCFQRRIHKWIMNWHSPSEIGIRSSPPALSQESSLKSPLQMFKSSFSIS